MSLESNERMQYLCVDSAPYDHLTQRSLSDSLGLTQEENETQTDPGLQKWTAEPEVESQGFWSQGQMGLCDLAVTQTSKFIFKV